MNRRRWLLILGGTLLLGATVVLSLALRQPTAPFRFLAGHEGQPGHGLEAENYVIFSFQTDYAELVRAAEQELSTEGYRVAPDSEIFEAELLAASKFGPIIPLKVEIYRNTRDKPWTFPTGQDSGWVTIRLDYRNLPNTYWDKVKAVFGL